MYLELVDADMSWIADPHCETPKPPCFFSGAALRLFDRLDFVS